MHSEENIKYSSNVHVAVKVICTTSEEVQHNDPEMTRDSEWSSLPLEAPAIEAMCKAFTLEEDTEPVDLIKIIDTCLKDVRRDKSIQAMKSLSLLTGVTKYVKLCAQYKACSKVCKQPCLKQALPLHLGWAGALILHAKFDILSCIS